MYGLGYTGRMIIGVDEVGRGAWAGPLVAAAVCFDEDAPKGLTDSKLLTKGQRKRLAPEIYKMAKAYGIGWVYPEDIDKLGITMAVKRAMELAVIELTQRLSDTTKIEIIVDGNYNFLASYPGSKAVVKADQSVRSVSAASIIAKVARDEYMSRLAQELPDFGFDTNVGYGTAAHILALSTYGPTIYHRKSFKPIALCLTPDTTR